MDSYTRVLENISEYKGLNVYNVGVSDHTGTVILSRKTGIPTQGHAKESGNLVFTDGKVQ